MSNAHTIDLRRTLELHARLVDAWRADSSVFSAAADTATRELARRGIGFGGGRPLRVPMSALVVDADGVALLRGIAERLFVLIERTLDWVTAEPARLKRFFPDHRRMFPFLMKSPGLDSWQGYSRYDAVITPGGEIKIIELNTGCPAGLLGNGTVISELTRTALGETGVDPPKPHVGFGTIPPAVLVDELLEVERTSGIEPSLIAVLNDENQLVHQLDQVAAEFHRRGREAEILSAAELTFDGGRLLAAGRPVSLTYNKLRVSTADSPFHHWSAGFEQRYAGLLAAIQAAAVASVNNLCALSIAEDKSLLGVLLAAETQSLFDADERSFLQRHIQPTARLDEPSTTGPREDFVIKPSNEGRGFGVTIGRFADEAQWREACRSRAELPKIVQAYAEPARLPVVIECGGQWQAVETYLTVGLGIARGKYLGLMSRISASPVTNVAQDGMVHGVFVIAK